MKPLVLVLAGLAACGTRATGAMPAAREPEQMRVRRARVVASARALLRPGAPAAVGVSFGSDPVGFVRAAFWAAGVDLFDPELAVDQHLHDMEILYRTASERRWLHRETPRSGDLIFLDRDTRGTALYPSQVAVIEGTESDGTFTALGWFAAGPARITVNLRATGGAQRKLNDLLRGEEAHPAAALFRAFANPYLSPPS